MSSLTVQVVQYLHDMEVERGLSPNTVAAYGLDLQKFVTFVTAEGLTTWPTKASDINAFISRQQIKASSMSRLISSLRKFYQWLARQNIEKLNPMLEIDAPKRTVSAPVVLSIAELSRLLAQPDLSKPMGVRDRAILETMIATGMRVTEVITLVVTNLYPQLQLVKVAAPRQPERLIPISQSALTWLERYQKNVRTPKLAQLKQTESILFLNNRGSGMSRQAIWQRLKYYCDQANIQQDVTPNTLRHSFARHLLDRGANLQVVRTILGGSDPINSQLTATLSPQQVLEVYRQLQPQITGD
ncbi:MAG: tyrosine-type recombinase/integrase [Lactobacillus sp.]|nr:tyrosine-type recombinase/integrase [Lactobacillus sp.]MDN6042614.1 tyrosine-type recombinase/integrase [Lactobacillus sp.]MDN6052330.1 tyrosine-type recombinase/integrase [Lactobacillus sp.]